MKPSPGSAAVEEDLRALLDLEPLRAARRSACAASAASTISPR